MVRLTFLIAGCVCVCARCMRCVSGPASPAQSCQAITGVCFFQVFLVVGMANIACIFDDEVLMDWITLASYGNMLQTSTHFQKTIKLPIHAFIVFPKCHGIKNPVDGQLLQCTCNPKFKVHANKKENDKVIKRCGSHANKSDQRTVWSLSVSCFNWKVLQPEAPAPERKVPDSLYSHLQQYVELVDTALPWHDKSNIMCDSFHQFSMACRKLFPAAMFFADPNVGTVGTHVKIVAAYLVWLRFKGRETSSPARKASTVLNLFQQTKSGLRNQLHPDSPQPDWLSAPPKSILVVKKLLGSWEREDLKDMPVKSYLLAEHIEHFCLEALWHHMQVSDSPKVHLFLLHALLLRLQCGSDSRHVSLVGLTWTDVQRFHSTVQPNAHVFSVKLLPSKTLCPTPAPIEFQATDVITSKLLTLWHQYHSPQSTRSNAHHVYVFPHVGANDSLDFTQPLSYDEHKRACKCCVEAIGLEVSTAFHANLGANSVRRGNAATVGKEIRGPSQM